MKASIIVFPGSNCDRDSKVALEKCGWNAEYVWHDEASLPKSDLVVLPGGFSYGDYLRCGAIAGNSRIINDVISHANNGGYVIGICNGFQILSETGLVEGSLVRNKDMKFICNDAKLRIENNSAAFTKGYNSGQVVTFPVAHHDGNYFADADTIKSLEDNNQVALRYSNNTGLVDSSTNINGSVNNIAGVLNKAGNVLGLMPHPERATDEYTAGTDGIAMFNSLLG